MSKSYNEYLIHGTEVENALRILQLQKILANPPKKYKVMLADWKSTNQIFTQLIYKGIPNQEYFIPHWGSIAFVLSKELLKDYPFYATRIGGFLNNFEDAFNVKEVENKEDIIVKSPKGGLSRMPNLSKLRKHINDYCKNGYQIMDKLTFMHSNEILFNRDISLDKYCVAVIANPWITSKEASELEKICETLEIPFTIYNKDVARTIKRKAFGIDKFVDLIDLIGK